MEVVLNKRYPLQVGRAQAWAVLADIRATAGCMPGAAITEQTDDTHYKGTVKTKVGPAVMSFAGDVEVLGVDAATHELQLMAKGADKSGSSAAMKLKAHLEAGETAGTAVLVGQATVTVSGKLAQFGSRLLVPVSDAMLAQFADNFRAAAAALPASEAPALPSVSATAASVTSDTATAGPATLSTHSVPPPAPVKELNALALMWTVFKAWLAGLFGKKA
ncbi:MAG: SRPBCC family protein [Betaproteobacteria bacterium]|nr:SRPBCC family protein [Betaproteobacteria bacterium]